MEALSGRQSNKCESNQQEFIQRRSIVCAHLALGLICLPQSLIPTLIHSSGKSHYTTELELAQFLENQQRYFTLKFCLLLLFRLCYYACKTDNERHLFRTSLRAPPTPSTELRLTAAAAAAAFVQLPSLV
ncbi:unnamed protein product [Ceratitis capitata]|uniref:(Mediterranean fruit fly) hypothetical protein n=1 Tax=Ceratitis capitata TaxID=7213 RepID=A0A811UJG4_CERCA|nr:unnamed protein product [Ceratitis capitata]